jgi:DNA polymerase III delta prime subunit
MTKTWHHGGYRDPAKQPEVFESFDAAFDQLKRRLLLLGGPGSGKTTILLHVARQLIAEARHNSDAPVPLLLNLSSFELPESQPRFLGLSLLRARARNKTPEFAFDQWLGKELKSLPVRGLTNIADRWIEEGRIALLLDGLDEIKESRAADLVRTLDGSFLYHNSDLPTVVCCRVQDYKRLVPTSLHLDGAVTLQPLEREQIDAYLGAADATSLRDLLTEDQELFELARTPLNLSMMTLAYADIAPGWLPPNLPLIERRYHLFDTFVERIMQRSAWRKAGKPFDFEAEEDIRAPYSLAEVNRFLGWHASRLSERMQTSFAPRDLIDLLAKETSPATIRLWTELRQARLLWVFILSAALSLLVAAEQHTRFPWLAALAGPTLYFMSCLLIPWATKAARRFKGATRLRVWLLVALAVVAIVLSPFNLLFFYFAVTSLQKLLPWAISWTVLGTVTLAAYSFATQRSTEPKPWPVNRRRAIALAIAAATLAFLVRWRPWVLLLPAFLGGYAHFRRVMRRGDKEFAAKLKGTVRNAILEATALLFSLVTFMLVVGMVSGIGWLGARLLGPAIPGWAIFVAVCWLGHTGENWGSSRDGAYAAMALSVVLGMLQRHFSVTVAAAFLLTEGGLFLSSLAGISVGRFFLRPIVTTLLAIRGRLPWRYQRFVTYATEILLLRRTGEECGFAHRLLRDHFALRQLVPLLVDDRLEVRVDAVQRIAAQGESSLDALRELMSHPDPAVREAAVTSLEGLKKKEAPCPATSDAHSLT